MKRPPILFESTPKEGAVYLMRVGHEYRLSNGGEQCDESWEIRFPQPLHPAEKELLRVLKSRLHTEEVFDFLPTRNNDPEHGHISWMDSADNMVVYSYRFNSGDPAWFCSSSLTRGSDIEPYWPIIRVGKQTPIEDLAQVNDEDDL